jgi:hypothetical protein
MSINISKPGCKKCGQNSLPVKTWVTVLGLYITVSAIYGTIKIVENIINLF